MASLLYFNTTNEFVKVDLTKVVYMEADGNYCHVFFSNSYEVLVTISLLQMQSLIAKTLGADNKAQYIRVGRKYIINTSYLVGVNVARKQVVMTDFSHKPMTLEVPKEAARDLKQLLVNNLSIKK